MEKEMKCRLRIYEEAEAKGYYDTPYAKLSEFRKGEMAGLRLAAAEIAEDEELQNAWKEYTERKKKETSILIIVRVYTRTIKQRHEIKTRTNKPKTRTIKRNHFK